MKIAPLVAALLFGSLSGWFLNDLGRQSPSQTTQEYATGSAPANPSSGERPAYMIVLGTVHDRDAFMQGYAAKLPPIYEKYGGHYLALGGRHEVLEGKPQFESHVISQWPSMEAARAFWDSPEYAPLKRARIENNWGEFDVFLVEGMPAPDATPAVSGTQAPD